ncbi:MULTISPECIES: macro domain-containing protein [unclassified Nocardioides]|uniref:macro domain-containing protein n=1 Tax=unclassified Nocardioides TaxID=2615069 RepID=UPI0013FDC21F|nr:MULTISPECIES: macro domain-containing protein [unclassified Nocardioides]
MRVLEVDGDLLAQPVQALVNPWNRNFVPRWLLLTGGVSGQLKRATGPAPWRDLAKMGLLDVGDAVVTTTGDMAREPHTDSADVMPGPKWLIHVVGLNTWWRATSAGVEACTRNAVMRASELGIESIAMPLIGAGHGGLSPTAARAAILRGLTAPANGPDNDERGNDRLGDGGRDAPLEVRLCSPAFR